MCVADLPGPVVSSDKEDPVSGQEPGKSEGAQAALLRVPGDVELEFGRAEAGRAGPGGLCLAEDASVGDSEARRGVGVGVLEPAEEWLGWL